MADRANMTWKRRLIHAFAWLRGREPIVLVALLVVAATTWGFIEIADEVLEGDTLAFDERIVRAMRRADDPAVPIGPKWLHELGRDATAFGGIGALVFFTLVAAGYLWLDRKLRMSLYLIAASSGALIVGMTMKQLFGRPRPEIVPHLSYVYTSSFPSGHSMLSAAVYLTLGSLLAASIPGMSRKIYVLATAIVLTGMVGVSRVYLGVHYPTDVLAGWMAGLIWALLCWFVARWLQVKHQVEGERETTKDLA